MPKQQIIKTIELNIDVEALRQQYLCVNRFLITAKTEKDRNDLEGAVALLEDIYDQFNPIPY